MSRLKVNDLPKDMTISRDAMKRIKGGAFDCFLKIDGLDGEAGGGGDALGVTKQLDKSSPKLHLAC